MTFGDRLKNARLKKGLTQEQLAQQIGVAKSTLTGYEKGNREPDVFKIKRILEVLNIDSNYLFDIHRDELGPHEKSLIATEEQETSSAELIEKLTNVLTEAGFIKDGEDLSDDDLEFCKALYLLVHAYYGKKGQ